jgi:hypothetical protein
VDLPGGPRRSPGGSAALAGLIVGSLWIAILVHALVAFPTGRLPTPAAATTVAAAYAVVTGGQLVVVLFDDLVEECPECPENAVLITADPGVAAVLDTVVGTIGALIALAVVVGLARRWRSASGPLRRALSPVVSIGGAAIVEVADDGSGGADPARGSGLRGLADRVEALDGRLEVLSPRGSGTRLRATFPLGAGSVESATSRPGTTSPASL